MILCNHKILINIVTVLLIFICGKNSNSLFLAQFYILEPIHRNCLHGDYIIVIEKTIVGPVDISFEAS